jgi:hypothetical protein
MSTEEKPKTKPRLVVKKSTNVMMKSFSLSKDDPFSTIFISPDDIKKKIAVKITEAFRRKNVEIKARQ